MKTFKKISAFIVALITLLTCSFMTACEEKNKNIEIIEYKIFSLSSFTINWDGVVVLYRNEGATIEMHNDSEKGMILFSKYECIKNVEQYSYYREPDECSGGTRQLLYGEKLYYEGINESVFYYEGASDFQWCPLGRDWGENTIGVYDYITFIARKDDVIVGYAVICVWVDDEYGRGKVLVNKSVSTQDEEEVQKKIDKVINKHKKSVS